MFSRKQYLENQPWLDNAYLVVPPGIKQCQLCNKRRYTVDFVNCDLFTDGKLPVCSICLRTKRRGEIARDMVNGTGFTKTCRKCEGETGLANFVIDYARKNVITDNCLDCERAAINARLGMTVG